MTTYVFKGLSKWSKEGLDLADSSFSKLHSSESKFEKDKKKYNLSSETFKLYTENLIEKVEWIHAMEQCTVYLYIVDTQEEQVSVSKAILGME